MGAFPFILACVIFSLLYYVLLQRELDGQVQILVKPSKPNIPDFSHYESIHTLSADEFPIDDPNRRVIVVGDIHGMIKPLRALLKRVSFNRHTDVLVHVGDFLSKGPPSGSLATLAFMTTHNITGVRGNQDQKVIEWRGWIGWITSMPEGKRWLEGIQRRWTEVEGRGEELGEWVQRERRRALGGGGAKQGKGRKGRGKKGKPGDDEDDDDDAQWWARIPNKWELFGDEYMIARGMSDREYQYLLQLPLKIYIPSAHTYIVHAGLLPSDPRYKYYDKRQPLATVPRGKHLMLNGGGATKPDPSMRRRQELALLTQVPQNTDPWVTLNMRGVIGHKVTRDPKKGKPWPKLWKRDMSHCKGFNAMLAPSEEHALPCYPSTVIYGHSASRGLDIQRWTFGLDSGCVYERKLSALVIGPNVNQLFLDVEGPQDYEFDNDDHDDEEGDDEVEKVEQGTDPEAPRPHPLRAGKNRKNNAVVPFGDKGKARIVKVKCRR